LNKNVLSDLPHSPCGVKSLSEAYDMVDRTFVTIAILTVYLTTPGVASARQLPGHGPAAGPHRVERAAVRADDLYAPRARRRFAAYLRLRLLEMREAGFERAAAVIERRLPIETLVPRLREH